MATDFSVRIALPLIMETCGSHLELQSGPVGAGPLFYACQAHGHDTRLVRSVQGRLLVRHLHRSIEVSARDLYHHDAMP